MRLTEHEAEAIKRIIYSLDSDTKIFLFGSRAYTEKKGGDIDLLLLSETLTQRDIYTIKSQLWERIGEQKIDIILAKDESHPFTKIALEEGIELC